VGDLQYLNAANTWTTLETFDIVVDNVLLPHHWKLTFDMLSQEYISLRFDDRIYDLRGIAHRYAASAVLPQIRIDLAVQPDIATAANARFDDIMVTDVEP